jgi:hypothetical protein
LVFMVGQRIRNPAEDSPYERAMKESWLAFVWSA